MLNWLRQVLRKLERRWIHDPDERARHDKRARRRLRGQPAEDRPSEQPPEG